MAELFDDWPEKYDQWFETPIGRLIKKYERDLVLEMLRPEQGERILDAGCGTGVFTLDVLAAGAQIVGLELSLPMLLRAGRKLEGHLFHMVRGDMRRLPFDDNAFDKTVSVTAIEFIVDATTAAATLLSIDNLVAKLSRNSLFFCAGSSSSTRISAAQVRAVSFCSVDKDLTARSTDSSQSAIVRALAIR